MESALAVANYFIQKSEETGYELTPMKVIKLVYIAHGWHLGLLKKPLIEEEVQAWQYGPVIETVYHAFKRFGASRIEGPADTGNFFKSNIPQVEDSQVKGLLDSVWKAYGKFSGTQLSALTHQPNTPWDIVWNHPSYRNLFNIIPNDLIQEHYEQIINARREHSSSPAA
ncbi:type II toxin-antitoxin system antitoxin SocA domain-containing protein [Pontibacter sp. H259]|uniref:Panacea domain-containing protein n=1 Tax=Pontibacter sp. H259 TaxID=3133421 RepID=UPI0030C56D3E